MFLSIEKGFIKNYQQDRINSLIKANSYYAMKKIYYYYYFNLEKNLSEIDFQKLMVYQKMPI